MEGEGNGGELTANKGAEELRDGEVVGARDLGCPRAGEEVRAEPALFARLRVLGGVGAGEAEVGVDAHKLVFDAYLQALHARRLDHLLFLGKHMLDGALVDCLLDDLEHAVLEHRAAYNRPGATRHDFRDEAVGAEDAADEGVSAFDERRADEGEGCEQHSVAVPHVGEGHWIVVAPGGEGGGHPQRRGCGLDGCASDAPDKGVAEKTLHFPTFLVILGFAGCGMVERAWCHGFHRRGRGE